MLKIYRVLLNLKKYPINKSPFQNNEHQKRLSNKTKISFFNKAQTS